MNIPPYLEKLLLSNEAEFRIATLGLNGGNFLVCPNGKSIVILEVTIQPFANLFDAPTNIFENGVTVDPYDTFWSTYISKRFIYQMQIANDKYNQHISFTNAFSVVPQIDQVIAQQTYLSIQFFEKKESLFIYSDRGMYFNFLFYDPNAETIQFSNDPFSTSFKTNIQAEPQYPITNLNNPNTRNYSTYENSTKTLAYYPNIKAQTIPGVTPSAPGESEYFRLVNGVLPQNTVYDNVSSIGAYSLDVRRTFIFPLFNVKYAIVNQRSSDKGIF